MPSIHFGSADGSSKACDFSKPSVLIDKRWSVATISWLSQRRWLNVPSPSQSKVNLQNWIIQTLNQQPTSWTQLSCTAFQLCLTSPSKSDLLALEKRHEALKYHQQVGCRESGFWCSWQNNTRYLPRKVMNALNASMTELWSPHFLIHSNHSQASNTSFLPRLTCLCLFSFMSCLEFDTRIYNEDSFDMACNAHPSQQSTGNEISIDGNLRACKAEPV